MATYYHTEGICLRRLDYSNTSQVATFLTPGEGQLPCIARGIHRASRRRISTGLDLTARYDLVYFKRRSGSLFTITECSMLEGFDGLRQSVQRTLCAYYAAELLLNFVAESDPCPALYERATAALRRFARGEALGLSVLCLEIAALEHYGACPTFDRCAECDAPLRLTGRLLFSAAQGGPLCRTCGRRLYRRPHPSAFPVRAERLAALAALTGPAPVPAPMDPREIVAASRLLRFHIRYLLGKEFALWKYLHGRHLSRTLRQARRSAGLAQ